MASRSTPRALRRVVNIDYTPLGKMWKDVGVIEEPREFIEKGKRMSEVKFQIEQEEVDFGGRKLVLETGHIARQADGAVVVTYGETKVLCTVVGAKKAAEAADFFPLTVHYQERMYAAGKIPGGFFKREGKPTEGETLISRLIDRPLRPLFPDGFFNEVQVVCTVLAHDQENNPDIPSIIGASAALALSGLPFQGPVAAARVGYKKGEFILNPLHKEITSGQLDLVVAGTKDGVLMVESEAQQLSEKIMLEAVKFGHSHFAPVLEAIESLCKKAGKPQWKIPELPKAFSELKSSIRKSIEKDLRKAYAIRPKLERRDAVAECWDKVEAELGAEATSKTISWAKRIFSELEHELLRTDILEKSQRIDGRALDEVRPLSCEVAFLPRAHGSALFTRGETQALVVATLGSGEDEQLVDGLVGDYKERFLVHYNFPPFAVGETGRLGAPGRREIGHGRLAWRALHPLIPSASKFPYTIRIVSEIMESNGSSSMATVCGSSLALMDAGVPLPKPVAGIAMGLVKEGDKFAVLTDIMGDEDHLGDMDFKVAGTEDGVTALQMDIKITSITFEIMEQALEQAHRGRQHIAKKMAEALAEPRQELSSYAPQITSVRIDRDKIRDLIGPGGKVIREICDTTGAKIDIEDDGSVAVFGQNQEVLEKALAQINAIVGEPEIGQVYTGPVVKVTDFGVFVRYFGNREGLVHVSEISTKRVENIEDYVREGDTVQVVLLGFDARTRKPRLSMKAVENPKNPSSSYEHTAGRPDSKPSRDGKGEKKTKPRASRPSSRKES